mmetsp:Transcript_15028/g.26722  ORF Transcript_15028/g.26722 Transcript_15028/m.26722 type:complete len:97 (+) Transcript_15028:688-978(+)
MRSAHKRRVPTMTWQRQRPWLSLERWSPDPDFRQFHNQTAVPKVVKLTNQLDLVHLSRTSQEPFQARGVIGASTRPGGQSQHEVAQTPEHSYHRNT